MQAGKDVQGVFNLEMFDFFFFFMFIFVRERAGMCTQAGMGQREGGRVSKVGSVLTADSPMWG